MSDDYDDTSNADVFTTDELYEMDRDAEYRLDAEDDARNTAEVEADGRLVSGPPARFGRGDRGRDHPPSRRRGRRMTREERRVLLGDEVIARIHECVKAAPDPSPELVEKLRRIMTRPAGAALAPGPASEKDRHQAGTAHG